MKFWITTGLFIVGFYLAMKTLQNWKSGFSTGSDSLSSSIGTTLNTPGQVAATAVDTLIAEGKNVRDYFFATSPTSYSP